MKAPISLREAVIHHVELRNLSILTLWFVIDYLKVQILRQRERGFDQSDGIVLSCSNIYLKVFSDYFCTSDSENPGKGEHKNVSKKIKQLTNELVF